MKRAVSTLLLASCFSESDDIGAVDTSTSSESSSSESTATSSDPSSSPSTTEDPSSSSTSTSEVADESSSEDSASSSESSTGEEITDWAIYFDGTNPAQSMTDLDLGLGNEFTVEAWVRVDSSDAQGTIVSSLGVGTSGWSLGFDEGSDLSFGLYDNNGEWNVVVGANADVLSPGWTHIAAIKSGTSLFLYVGGDLDSTSAASMTSSSPTVPLVLGDGSQHGAAQYFALDDLRVSTGRRYETNFEPDYDLQADADAKIRVLFDEGMGSIAVGDGSVAATFDLGTSTWVEGVTP